MADPFTIAAIGVGLAGTAMSTFGAIREGQAANAAAKFEAQQLEQRAKEQEAAGQLSALEERRKSNILQSRALAVAGASGGGALDPNVLNIVSGLAGEGEQAFQSELFNARSRAGTLEAQAAGRRFEGKQAKTAGLIKGVSTAFSGLSSAAMGGASFFGGTKPVGDAPALGFDDFVTAGNRNVNIPGMR